MLKAIANEVASSVGELAGAARSMAGVIGRGHEGKHLDRKAIVDMLKANVERNQFAFGQLVRRRAERIRRPVAVLRRPHGSRLGQDGRFQCLLDQYWLPMAASPSPSSI